MEDSNVPQPAPTPTPINPEPAVQPPMPAPAPVDPAAPQPSVPPSLPPTNDGRSKKRLLIILIAVVCLILVLGGAYFVFKPKKASNSTTPTSSTDTTSSAASNDNGVNTTPQQLAGTFFNYALQGDYATIYNKYLETNSKKTITAEKLAAAFNGLPDVKTCMTLFKDYTLAGKLEAQSDGGFNLTYDGKNVEKSGKTTTQDTCTMTFHVRMQPSDSTWLFYTPGTAQ